MASLQLGLWPSAAARSATLNAMRETRPPAREVSAVRAPRQRTADEAAEVSVRPGIVTLLQEVRRAAGPGLAPVLLQASLVRSGGPWPGPALRAGHYELLIELARPDQQRVSPWQVSGFMCRLLAAGFERDPRPAPAPRQPGNASLRVLRRSSTASGGRR